MMLMTHLASVVLSMLSLARSFQDNLVAMVDSNGKIHAEHVAADAHGDAIAAQHGNGQTLDHNDPCASLGCNSHKCAWVSGEVISKVATKKACDNAKALGNQTANSIGLLKIETLTQCLRAVQGKSNQDPECSTFFEMNMETFQCSCVPAGGTCTEKAHEKVCRFQLKATAASQNHKAPQQLDTTAGVLPALAELQDQTTTENAVPDPLDEKVRQVEANVKTLVKLIRNTRAAIHVGPDGSITSDLIPSASLAASFIQTSQAKAHTVVDANSEDYLDEKSQSRVEADVNAVARHKIAMAAEGAQTAISSFVHGIAEELPSQPLLLGGILLVVIAGGVGFYVHKKNQAQPVNQAQNQAQQALNSASQHMPTRQEW